MSEPRHQLEYRLGVDVGGTFTDLALVEELSGDLLTEKVLTTASDPWLGISEGILALRARGVDPSAITTVVHGATLVVNALIERRGAKVGLVTTRGFRDILYFGRELRYDIYDPDMTLVQPLVPRHLRREVAERVGGDGIVYAGLDVEEATEVIIGLRNDGVEAFAVCLMHSYLHPQHELTLRQLIAELAPECPVSLSHQVLPQLGEYERFSATSINAYVQPLVQQYLNHLVAGLHDLGCHGPLYLMTSSGGTMTADTAMELPIYLLESGPAAGALIAGELGASAHLTDIMAFDMGGTTAKSCLIRNGEPLINRNYEVARGHRYARGSGLPVGIPVVDLLEIGAGGGSIAGVNEMGLLEVGPRSAGADPGPACYGRGGTNATVTDADVVLGLIRPEAFLGGSMLLDRKAAEQAIRAKVATPLQISVEDAAIAIYQVVSENMAQAVRVHSVEMNVDIRAMGLVAFGGAGPIHACTIAEHLGLSLTVCPRQAGVLSACGLLNAPLAFEFSQSLACNLDDLDIGRVNAVLKGLRQRGEKLLRYSAGGAGAISFSVDMCYVGQRYEVTTPIGASVLYPESIGVLKQAFDAAYEQAYGRHLSSLPARCITWRVLASGTPPKSVLKRDHYWGPADGDLSKGTRRKAIFPGHGEVDCLVVNARDLRYGVVLRGPAIIEEVATTIIVPPSAQAEVDAWGNVVIILGKGVDGSSSLGVGSKRDTKANIAPGNIDGNELRRNWIN